MGLKVALVLATVCQCLAPAASHAQTARKPYSGSDYLRNYALSTCIADGYRDEAVVKDSSAAARGYLELGSYPIEAHTEATKLAREFLKREYKSASGEPLTLMKCIDLYHSRELRQIIKKYGR